MESLRQRSVRAKCQHAVPFVFVSLLRASILPAALLFRLLWAQGLAVFIFRAATALASTPNPSLFHVQILLFHELR